MEALSPTATQIIPRELMAAAGMLHTYVSLLEGRDVVLYRQPKRLLRTNQRLQQIQGYTGHDLSVALSNPSAALPHLDRMGSINGEPLSREQRSMFPTSSGKVDKLILRPWLSMQGENSLQRILVWADENRGASYGSADPSLVPFRYAPCSTSSIDH